MSTLFARLAARDGDAVEDLFEAHGAAVVRVLTAALEREPTADELVGSAAYALDDAALSRPPAHERVWVMTCALKSVAPSLAGEPTRQARPDLAHLFGLATRSAVGALDPGPEQTLAHHLEPDDEIARLLARVQRAARAASEDESRDPGAYRQLAPRLRALL